MHNNIIINDCGGGLGTWAAAAARRETMARAPREKIRDQSAHYHNIQYKCM